MFLQQPTFSKSQHYYRQYLRKIIGTNSSQGRRLYVRLSPASTKAPSHQQSQAKTWIPSNTSLIERLYDGILQGDRVSLSRAITLVESSRPDHQRDAQILLSRLLHRDNEVPKSGRIQSRFEHGFRIGLSGAPGVGKSSFIETFGMYLIEQGHRVAVLAVDPSSSKTGGSILGDKTRMTYLSRQDNAYIRPSPAAGTLGGVARNTTEAILLCSAAGYDVILVETVGVGQSETMVADMVDMFTLLVSPGGGDELQGMKKGIVEMSDLIIVNKADGNLLPAANLAQMEYTSALKFVRPSYPDWKPIVMPISSREKLGIDQVWQNMQDFHDTMMKGDRLEKKRAEQAQKWMWRHISEELMNRLKDDAGVKAMLPMFETQVKKGEITAGLAADRILETFISDQKQLL